MAIRECDPMGIAEVAAFLGVKLRTVHQWKFRKEMPPEEFIINSAGAWHRSTIEGWAIQTGRVTPERLTERRAEWEKIKAERRTMAGRQRSAEGARRANAEQRDAKKSSPPAKRAKSVKR